MLFCCVFRFYKFSCEAFLQFGSLTFWLAHLFVLLVFFVVIVLASVWVHMEMMLAMSIALANAMACDEKDYSSGVVVVGVVGVTSTVCCQFSEEFEERSSKLEVFVFVVAVTVWLLRAAVPPRWRPLGLRVRH